MDFLINKAINEKRVKWIIRVMEYDIGIKKGLCEKMASSFETPKEVFLLIQGEKLVEIEDQND